MRYLKRPVEIDAWRISDLLACVRDGVRLPEPVREAARDGGVLVHAKFGFIVIRTLEGTMVGEAADYLICGIKGEFYPCKPDIFEASHEPVEKPKWQPSRSRERLAVVLVTVNGDVAGREVAKVMGEAAVCVQIGGSCLNDCAPALAPLLLHKSPHIRELAREALFYVGGIE